LLLSVIFLVKSTGPVGAKLNVIGDVSKVLGKSFIKLKMSKLEPRTLYFKLK